MARSFSFRECFDAVRTVLLYAAAATVLLLTHLIAWPVVAVLWLWYDPPFGRKGPVSASNTDPDPEYDPDVDSSYSHACDPDL